MPEKQRPPLRVAIIGAGISGLGQAIRLKELLDERAQVTIYERESRVGGVWRDSLWAGAGCDVPVHLYSLYSDLNPNWKVVYAEQPEILAYWEGLVDKHHLDDNLVYNTRYVSSAWSEEAQAHTITFARSSGEEFTAVADILISAVGPLAKPKIPELPGLDTFKGSYFHNLRWDPNVKLEGKKVAVIGSGSSGIQLIPGVAEIAGVHLTHFIRSGGYFVPKVNREYTDLQKFVFRWVPGAQRLYRNYLFLNIVQAQKWRINSNHPSRLRIEKDLLAHLVATAPAEYLQDLTPDYPLGCKRLALDAGWLKSLHRENVRLVKQTIVGVTPKGLRTADGNEYEADVIIFATGSDVPNYGIGLNHGLRGQDGLELRKYWDSIGGGQAYLGVAVPHFPNYFIVIGPNATASSWGFTSGNQSAFIARLIKEARRMLDNGLTSIQPKIIPFEEYNEKTQARFATSTLISPLCTNYNRVGHGRVVHGNSVSGVGLWWATRKTKFGDWAGTRRVGGALESVDVQSIVRRRRAFKITARQVYDGEFEVEVAATRV